jgi:hypothetical protein
MKTYIGISRDHSGSMNCIARAAARDYNNTITATQRAASANAIETALSVVRCGGGVQRDVACIPIGAAQLLEESAYRTDGHNTPLFDSVSMLVDDFLKLPDAADPETTFVIMATTDGQNNAGRVTAPELGRRIRELVATDRWTFVFRVPRGYAKDLVNMGIEPGNILEWEQTEKGVAAASVANETAFNEYYASRSVGVRSTKTFYSSMKSVTSADVKATLRDISGEVQLFPISSADDGKQIRTFVEARLGGKPMAKGAAFYQLSHAEDKVQGYKLIAVRDRTTNAIYSGDAARDMLGLPRGYDARVRPGDHGNFDVFIQSTSVNRKLCAGTQLMYWPNVPVKR